MTRKEMKLSLKSAVLSSTPDVLDKVLSATPQREASAKVFKEAPSTPKFHFSALACMAAALVFLVLGAVFLGQPKVESVVSIDVNPGIELSVDSRDRVLSSRALNEDAEKILDGMSLKYQEVDTATVRIFEEILHQGYLSAEKTDNTVLISVASENSEKAADLQNKICSNVKNVLKTNNTDAKIIQQQDTYSDDLKNFADEQGISLGKADLVRKLWEKDSSIDPTKASQFSLSELTTMIEEKEIDIGDTVKEFVEPPAEEQDPTSSLPLDSSSSESGSQSSESSSLESISSESSESSVGSTRPPTRPDYGTGYCEYCGEPVDLCKGRCDHSQGKRYCSVCGKLLVDCTCEKDPESSSSTDSSQTESSSSAPDYMDSGKEPEPDSSGTDSTPPESSGQSCCPDCGYPLEDCICEVSSSEEWNSSETSEDEFPYIVDGKYCIYCGKLVSICKDRCEAKIPRYCAQCGKVYSKCKCTRQD